METIRALGQFDLTVFTDGSAAGGIYRGGSAAVIFGGEVDHLVEIATRRKRGAVYTSSFEARRRWGRFAWDWSGWLRTVRADVI